MKLLNCSLFLSFAALAALALADPPPPVVASASSDSFRMDTREGPFASGGTETLTYSALWHGDTNAIVTILQDGTVLADATALNGEGEYAWSVPYDGTYVLTHATSGTNAVETATFVVTGLTRPFATNDIVLADCEAVYDGQPHTIGIETNAAIVGLELKFCGVSASEAQSLNTNHLPLTTDKPEYTNVCDMVVFVEASAPGYFTTNYSATVTITRRPVTFTGQSETNAYTGSEIVITDLVVSNLVAGQTHNVTFSAGGTEVGGPYAGTITPADGVVIKSGEETVTANYAVTVENGALTIGQNPALTLEVTLGGASFTYDGQPHALSGPATHNARSGATAVEYSKDESSWTTNLQALAATDVADSCTVHVRAANPNYANVASNTAALTIGPLSLSGATIGPIGTQYYEGQPLTPAVSVQIGGLSPAANTDYDADYTDNDRPGTATVTLTGRGNYTNEVSTTFQILPARLTLAVTAGKWGVVDVETNGVALAAVGPDATATFSIGYGASVTATAVPSAGFAVLGGTNSFSFASFTADTSVAFSFVPNPAAALRWKFSSAIGRYFAQVAIEAHAGYAEALEGLAYLFADRMNSVGDVYAQLWNVAARGPENVLVTDNGVEYRGVTLGSASFAGMPDGTTNVFGVADASFKEPRNIVPAGERQIGLYVRKRVNPVSGNETAGEVQDFLGYLTWTTDGIRYFMPIVENDSNGPVSTQAERPSSSLQYSFPVMQHAYAPAALNAAAALGLGAAAVADNPPMARIADFAVGADGAVSGRIEAVAGGETSSSFGGSATVRVLSAETPAGPWREASAAVDPATGAFSLPAGAVEGHFFRAEIETRAVYE